MKKYIKFIVSLLMFGTLGSIAQTISQFEQFNGRFDYTAIGNTLNEGENNVNSFCDILDSSTAELLLLNSQVITKAYLYWAGSGAADTEVYLNGNNITAELDYSVIYPSSLYGDLPYFSCFSDVTTLVQSIGNDSYVFSGIDISDALANNPGYCANRTNFAGWSLYVVYEDQSLPLNQLSVFQGLEIINTAQTSITIDLENINVWDNIGAKIGFLTWEGDANLSINETLTINNNILSNPPLNPSTNAFNGTNSFTTSSTFYNGDLDVYNIQNFINIGDESAQIALTTGADLIIINNIVTVLNSQLPDASINISTYEVDCETSEIRLDYIVSNNNSTDVLPIGTPIAIYLDGNLVGQSTTALDIPIGGQESQTITLNFSPIPSDSIFIEVVVDDSGSGVGIVNEIVETNNSTAITIEAMALESEIMLTPLNTCDQLEQVVFNLNSQFDLLDPEISDWETYFYENESDALMQINPIEFPHVYTPLSTPASIYLRASNGICYQIYNFELLNNDCPIEISEGLSPNGDGFNDILQIDAPHIIKIFNRFGKLIFQGDNNTPWNGTANRGAHKSNVLLPIGTYFYIIDLQDSSGQILRGWIYLNY